MKNGYWKWWYSHHKENVANWTIILVSYVVVSVLVTVFMQPKIQWYIQYDELWKLGILYALLLFPAMGIWISITVPYNSWKIYKQQTGVV